MSVLYNCLISPRLVLTGSHLQVRCRIPSLHYSTHWLEISEITYSNTELIYPKIFSFHPWQSDHLQPGLAWPLVATPAPPEIRIFQKEVEIYKLMALRIPVIIIMTVFAFCRTMLCFMLLKAKVLEWIPNIESLIVLWRFIAKTNCV